MMTWPTLIRRLPGPTVFLLVLAVYIARRPDIVLNAQFWAEDGKVWFHDALVHGLLRSLARPYGGYLQTECRLLMGVAALMPLEWAPLLANLAGLVFRALPAAFFATRRFNWIDPRARAVILAYYLFMPNLDEVHTNITNTHYYLALYLGLIAISTPPPTLAWRAHDWVVTIFCGLAGPFILFALPAYALRAWKHRGERPLFAVVLALAALAIAVTVYTLGDRSAGPLGASWLLPVQIVSTRVLAGFLAPLSWYPYFSETDVSISLFVLATAVTAFTVWRTGWKAAGIGLVAVLMVAGALYSPLIDERGPQWPLMLETTGGGRYFVLPMIVWTGMLVGAVSHALARMPAAVKTGASLVGIILVSYVLSNRFDIAPLDDFHWRDQIASYRASRAETAIPIPPAGWDVTLPAPTSVPTSPAH